MSSESVGYLSWCLVKQRGYTLHNALGSDESTLGSVRKRIGYGST